MGRECRRVPANWEHPKDADGWRRPMYDKSYREAAAEWKTGYAEWESGKRPEHCDPDSEYWDYAGPPPDPDFYRPYWTDAERTHYQMYETTSEGTPISPPCDSPESVARWCADNGASAFGHDTASYEHWLAVARGAWAPSMVIDGGQMKSGVRLAGESVGQEGANP